MARHAPEALFWLTVAWLTLDVLPGQLFRRLLPTPQAAAAAPQPATQPPPEAMRLVRDTVGAVSRRMPFRSVCFHRAIAAHRMLRSRGIPSSLHYGVRRDPNGSLQAHVWVTSHGNEAIGLRDAAGYTEVATLSGSTAWLR